MSNFFCESSTWRPVLHLLLVVAAFGPIGCGGDGPVGPGGITLQDLAGTWNATHFEYSQAEDGPVLPSFDLVAEGGSATLVIQTEGRFTLTRVDPSGSSENDTGILGFDPEAEDFILVVFDDEPEDELEFFFVMDSETSFQFIDNTGEGEFDLDGDGIPERARINSTWMR